MEKLIMTPGPTYIREDVREAMARAITNPDLDLEFYDFYYDICEKLKKLMNTKNRTLILSGEGILGLEASCASLIEKGDKVLCIENGIFGYGFGDFAKMYGAEVDYLSLDRGSGLDINAVDEYLKENNKYKLATLVHCETPSGITNPVGDICKVLDKYNIISVVDAVSSIGGEELKVDEWKIDIALGGSQKCLSAPPGLTFLSISNRALDAIENRKTDIIGFYTNLSIWNDWYENKWFPYTQPISDLYAFNKALDNILSDVNVLVRHKVLADACRTAITKGGLKLLSKNYHSNTVTTIMLPEGVDYKAVFNKMLKEHGVMIAGGFDFLQDKIIRIGHMGENCYEEKLYLTLKALDKVLTELDVKLESELHKAFVNELS